MKKSNSLLLFLMVVFLIIGCSTTSTPKRFIEIKESDVIHEYGKPKYEVWPGDKLEIIDIKRCRSGRGLCWKVKKLETGEIGYVSADRFKEIHHVYPDE
jgi:hypothetical protein